MAGVDAVYQFDLTGEDAGSWTLAIRDGKADVHQGTSEKPNTTFVASTQDWLQIVSGKMDPTMAFMQGKLKVKGDMSMAMKLQGLIK